MSVLIETDAGNIVVDLFCDDCPKTSLNFLKLCKIKYYNNVLIFNIQENFMIQSGDPTGTGKGGESVYKLLYGEQAKFFEDEIHPHLTFNKSYRLCMANTGPNTNTSQFFITTRDHDLEYLEGKHTIFGEVVEGEDVIQKLNESYVDEDGRPYRDTRILHTYVLDDPYDDPKMLEVPGASPTYFKPPAETVEERIAYNEDVSDTKGKTEEEIQEKLKAEEARSRAVVLEMIGDIPDADIKPPENVLFVCKLNPVTEDDDLEIIFSRFGEIKSLEIVRDKKTGDSLQYAFIEFATEEQCQEAYFKMNNVLVDDRRIKVDFSQSVAKLWNKFAINKTQQRQPRPSHDVPSSSSSSKRIPSHDDDRKRRRHDETEDKRYSKHHRARDRDRVDRRRSRSRDRKHSSRSRHHSRDRDERKHKRDKKEHRHRHHRDDRR